jgi:hypothetical protein
MYKMPYSFVNFTQAKRFSAAFQLITSQMALKYSALRFWYCR